MSSHNTPTEQSPLLVHSKGADGSKASVRVLNTDVDSEQNERVGTEGAVQFIGGQEAQKQMKWIVPAVGIGVFLALSDLTVVISSYGRIGSDLNSLNLASWIVTAYFVSLTSFQPLYGKLSDIFGRKPCLLCAYLIFGLGGLFCGLAQSMPQLIAARFVQGIGGGGMTVMVTIIFSDILPLKDRGMWQGIINVLGLVGMASGGPIGGLCADTIGWRWIFLSQVPLSLLAVLAVGTILNLPPRPFEDTWRSRLYRVDFFGAFVLVFAVLLFLFGIDRGANASWTDPISFSPLLASIVAFLQFTYVELRVATEPFAPSRVVLSRTMLPVHLCFFFSMAATFSILYYLPLYFQVVTSMSATDTGLCLLPGALATVIGGLGGGVLLRATERFRILTICAFVLLVLGVIPLFLFSGLLARSIPGIIVGTVLTGLGTGSAIVTALIALIAHVDPADQAVATAVSYLFRGLGTTLGISVSGTFIQTVLRAKLRSDLGSSRDAERIERGVRLSLDYLDQLDPEVKAVVRRAYEIAVRHSYFGVLLWSLGALVSSFFIREKRLRS